MCKLVLTGFGNMPLLAMTLDGVKDDGILNLSALARRLNCSRSSLLDRINQHGLESTIRHYLNEKRQRQISKT
jgi:AraC-like DNA-binding protein